MQENEHKEETLKKISGLYQDWFLDYASYVILDRAIPSVYDGFKPVQRRIMHSMRELEDGRYNKVANIVGNTMKYHPHGDASITDAMVQIGQKELLIDTQGNWGNIYTGDSAAAARYIEARLTPFALEVVFNPKTTEWIKSYDGRNNEPVDLPVKFPLLLAQGVEGIGVGLSTKIMPHNFNELLDASILYLKGKSFQLYPDFLTAGLLDVSNYNDGKRGGKIRARARIIQKDKNTLCITELPFSKNTGDLIDSILKANEKGKIKIKKIEDNTSDEVEINILLANDVSPDMMIDALYAFTDCEVSISPNACVIVGDKPMFLSVSEILKYNTDHTVSLLKKELEIELHELQEKWHFASLEKIFIENEIYQEIKGKTSKEEVYSAIDKALKPFIKNLMREVVTEDIARLTELPFMRISRYDRDKALENIAALEDRMEQVKHDLENLVDYAINYYREKLYFDIEFYQFLQYKFDEQWKKLKSYANENGIEIIGDIPIYVAMDSADTWAHRELFQMDEGGNAVAVAGCPPDGFAPDGQLWGNPLYNWGYHRDTGFKWWIKRLKKNYRNKKTISSQITTQQK